MDDLEAMLPQVCAWAEAQERRILADGAPLTESQRRDAVAMGVAFPDRVRVLRVPSVPIPDSPELRAASASLGFLPGGAAGMALGYGVFIQDDYWNVRSILAHELVHTSQYERLGGFAPFLKQYLTECLTVGYTHSELEREAVTKSAGVRREDAGE
ncbi:hypothetical protein CCAX7_17090 [Capsulimonas corticalis]|uniref:DUF4157 domain-containing protein n=2 Tax=Capsulimonas corticalis TaxID=2219043 RepID=A0A9N7L2E3_9BACT|nr:hypothetical protein CCAX7_17090 [Capsulimonas corticalis]